MDFTFRNVKALCFRDILFYVVGQRVIKLDNPVTAEAYQVMVLCGRLRLIMMMGIVKVELLDQTQLL